MRTVRIGQVLGLMLLLNGCSNSIPSNSFTVPTAPTVSTARMTTLAVSSCAPPGVVSFDPLQLGHVTIHNTSPCTNTYTLILWHITGTSPGWGIDPPQIDVAH